MPCRLDDHARRVLSSVILVAAFHSQAPAPVEVQTIDFTPVVTTFENMQGGGNPNGGSPPPPPPPALAAPKPPEPNRDVARQSQAPPEEESYTPSPRPAPKKPLIDPKKIVELPRPKQKKPRVTEEDTSASAREQARAAADARKQLLHAFSSVAGHFAGDRSGPISLELKGPGGGGLPYANFNSAVYSIYEREWIVPNGATDVNTTTVAEIKVARDGTVVSADIKRRSGNLVVDQSVQLTLDRVRTLVPLPEGTEEPYKVTIYFNAKP